MAKKIFFLLILSSFASILNGQNSVSAPQKFALVIGNAHYSGISTLQNPLNDADDMAAALHDLGFVVDKVLNGKLDQMETAVMNFKSRLSASRNSYGFFYYAGHGIQSNGENYLLPVDMSGVQSEGQLRQRTLSVQALLENLDEAGNTLNMIVLDACRDNPFGWARSGSRGLSAVSSAPAGSIIMYATSANSTAEDGRGRRNGLFTSQLLNNLKTPGLSVRDIFDKTGEDVLRVSEGKQHPELFVRFFAASSTYLESISPTEKTGSIAAANSVHAGFARINGGSFLMGSPANEANRESDEDPQHLVTLKGFSMSIYPVTQSEWFDVMGTTVREQLRKTTRTGIIQGEGRNHPMYYVNWFEAIEYCNKRSLKEGLDPVYTITSTPNGPTVSWDRNATGYRLPTEAEWEYACRAGTTTAYNTGQNIDDFTGWYDANCTRSQAVGQKPANRWGLYDMHGNVWEWCWDRYGNYASHEQADPGGAASGNTHILRGGGWSASAGYLRSAFRYYLNPTTRDSSLGFRVVRN